MPLRVNLRRLRCWTQASRLPGAATSQISPRARANFQVINFFPLKLKFSSVHNWQNGISTTLLSINRATCMLESNATYSHQCFAVHKMDPHPKNDILHNIFLLGFSEIPDLRSQLQSEKLIQSSEGKFIILHNWSNWVRKAILEAILLR